MIRKITATLVLLAGGAAMADQIAVFDEAGAPLALDLTALKSCEIVFDSNGLAFEICPLEKVEAPHRHSSRTRPGHAPQPERVDKPGAGASYIRVRE